MTIIKPRESRNYFRFLLFIFAIVFVGGLFYVYEYASFVDLRQQLRAAKALVVDLETANAELKNALYQAVSAPALEKIAVEQKLVMDRNPNYLNLNQWLSDSSF